MALPALPAFNTKRYFVGNLADTLQHHIQIRVSDAVTDSAIVPVLQAAFSSLIPVMFGSTSFNTLDVALRGSDVRNPVAGWTVLTGTGTANQPDEGRPFTLCARGRSNTGRKVRLFLWGMQITTNPNWMFTPGSATDFRTFLNFLNGATNVYLAIDGSQPLWKLDYTQQYNDHWVRKAR